MKTFKQNIEYWSYSNKCITILWHGRIQPLGRFYSAIEALEIIKKQCDSLGTKINEYSIKTPDIIINL